VSEGTQEGKSSPKPSGPGNKDRMLKASRTSVLMAPMAGVTQAWEQGANVKGAEREGLASSEMWSRPGSKMNLICSQTTQHQPYSQRGRLNSGRVLIWKILPFESLSVLVS
jgi:hypothetical protein